MVDEGGTGSDRYRRWLVRGVVAVLLVGGVAAGQWRSRRIDEDLRRQLLVEATAIARTVSAGEASALTFSSADAGTPVFERLRSQLTSYAQSFGHRAIWTVARRDGVIVNGPESLKPGDPLASLPGTPYHSPPAELLEVFSSLRGRTVGPYTDEDGTFITAFAPVVHPRSGELVLAVALDVEAQRWRMQVARGYLGPGGLALLLVVLTSAGGRLLHRSHRSEVWLTAVCGVLLTVGVSILAHEAEGRRRQRTFAQIAGAQQGFLADTLRDMQEFQLPSLARFFDGSEFVTREEFRVFAGPLAASGAVQGWGWVPRVPAEDRDRVELEARRDGLEGYTIYEFSPDGGRVPASDRATLFPLLYVEPIEENALALGFDLGSESVRAEALRRAADSGLITASGPVNLAQDETAQPSIVVFHPVSRAERPEPPRSPIGQPQEGFVVAAVRLGATLHESMVHTWLGETVASIALLQIEAGTDPELVAVFPPGNPLAARSANEIVHLGVREPAAVFPLFVFGTTFAEVMVPGPGFLAANPARAGATATLVGLLLTGLLAVFAGFLTTRKVELEAEVASRTALLRGSEERYRELFLTHPLPMWVYDLETMAFLAVNRAAATRYGWSEEEFLAMTLRDIRPPEDLSRLEESVAHSRVQPGYEHSSGWRHCTRRGEVLDVEISSHDLVYDGRRARVVVAQDVTDRMRLEEQLRHAQKMEAIGRLAGGIAHDFNNLLQALLSATQSARLQTEDPGLASTLDEVQTHVRSGAALARQLLLFARRETTRLKPVDLAALVADQAVLLRRLLPENIELEMTGVSGPLVVDADSGQMGQVLTNLALNARDAMTGAGRLSIRTGGDGRHVFMEVCDTGAGMDSEVYEHIFEPFFTTKTVGEGTGLGLPVVHGIVTAHGGRLEVETKAGKGSCFRMWLPRAAASAEAEPEDVGPAEEPPGGRGERVLVVEDEEGARGALTELLGLMGYQVTAVASGEAAQALPEVPSFDLLLTDIMLPGTSGIEVAGALQSRWPRLAVILMSGYAADERVRQTLSDGAGRFLGKPFDMATLARELRAALAEAERLCGAEDAGGD